MQTGYVIRDTSINLLLVKGKQPKLSHIDLELTERCNNNCIHCYINLPEEDNTAKSRELNTDQWQGILHQAADLGALSVRFTGGEPLLRDDFEDLYLYARRLGMRVKLFTNARLITAEMASLFSRIPPMEKIEVSVYGMSPQSYDSVARVPGAYQEFHDGVQRLLGWNVPFVLKSVVLPPNRDDVSALDTWAETIPGMPAPSHSLMLDLRTRRDSEAKNRLIMKLRLSSNEYVQLLTQKEEDYRRKWGQFSEKFLYPQGDQLFNCGAGLNGCVDSYGVIQMCMLLRHPDFVYDLKSGSLKEAILDVFPKYRQVRSTDPRYLERCGKCFIKGLCEQCPGKSWSEHGTLDTPVEYLCDLAHGQARFLGFLTAEEHSWQVSDWEERVKQVVNKAVD